MMPFYDAHDAGSMVAVIYFGGINVVQGTMHQIIAFVNSVITPLMMVSQLLSCSRAGASSSIDEVLMTTIVDRPMPGMCSCAVRLCSRMSFAYGNKTAMPPLSPPFLANAGEHVWHTGKPIPAR